MAATLDFWDISYKAPLRHDIAPVGDVKPTSTTRQQALAPLAKAFAEVVQTPPVCWSVSPRWSTLQMQMDDSVLIHQR